MEGQTSAIQQATPEDLEKYLFEQELRRWREEEFLRFYRPQSYQLAFHESVAHRRLSHGGVRSGKTLTNLVDIVWRCMGLDFGTSWATWTPSFLHSIKTPQYWRVAGPGMQEHVLKVLIEWLRKICPRDTLEGDRFNYSTQTHQLRWKNGSWIEAMSYDQEEGKGAGRPLHGYLLDESHKAPKYFRKQCNNRLIDFDGLGFASGCPEDGITWEYDWYDKAHNGDPDTQAYQFPTIENKYLPKGAIERIKKDYDFDERILRVVLYGDFVAIGGLIYEMLHSSIHKREAKDIGVQPDWPIYVSIDPGIQKAHAVIWGAVGPGRQFHVFREASIGRDTQTQTMKELAWAIRDKSRDERIHGFCFDPNWNWNNRVATNKLDEPYNLERELRTALKEVGYEDVPLIPARKDRVAWFGIDEVKKYLRSNETIKRPLLTFSHDVPETWQQMASYQCIPQKQTQQNDHRPRIRKVDDDFCDAVRYLLTSPGVEYVGYGGGGVVLSEVVEDEYGVAW